MPAGVQKGAQLAEPRAVEPEEDPRIRPRVAKDMAATGGAIQGGREPRRHVVSGVAHCLVGYFLVGNATEEGCGDLRGA